jgi:glycosyltransferase involved in cell wall biosynthesis
MKILYDHQIFSWQYAGGISRYFYELIKNIKKFKGFVGENSTLLSNNIYISKSSSKPLKVLQNIYIPGKTQLIKYIDKVYSIYKIKTGKYDIFHPTYYDDYFLDYIGSKPYVLTVYDMIHEIFPDNFSGDTTSIMKKKILLSAHKVIAISQSTKNDIIRLLNIKPEQITIIHLASSLNPKKYKKVSLPKKFILYVGDRGKYKNFSKVVEALKTLGSNVNDISLVCIGGGDFTKNETQLMGQFKHRCHYYNLTDMELVYAYKSAICLVFPSFYEGFGLPILEAMQCGCPVICSNTSSMPEVGGDSVAYFDPTKISDIKGKINMFLDNPTKRSEFAKKGLLRSKKFSWEKCANQTKNLYNDLYAASKLLSV